MYTDNLLNVFIYNNNKKKGSNPFTDRHLTIHWPQVHIWFKFIRIRHFGSIFDVNNFCY